MATDISNQLAAAAPLTAPVVRGVRDDQLDAPTPCADYAVRDLLNHLFLVVVNFQAPRPGGRRTSAPHRTTSARCGRAAGATGSTRRPGA